MTQDEFDKGVQEKMKLSPAQRLAGFNEAARKAVLGRAEMAKAMADAERAGEDVEPYRAAIAEFDAISNAISYSLEKLVGKNANQN